MGIDFREQLENPEGFGPGAQPVIREVPSTDEKPVEEQFRNPVTFPLNWWARIIQYGIPVAAFSYAAYVAVTGEPQKDLVHILVASAGVLIGLCILPNTLVVDDAGVHQVFCLGLWVRTLRYSEIRSWRVATRRQLRIEGKLWFQWRNDAHDDHDFEEVVFVEGRYGKKYIMHTKLHSGHFLFIEQLEKRGVTPHGYEDWNKFMEERGIPMTGPKA